MAKKPPSLVSIAANLGVSRQTVSNVINWPERVAPETRERVEAAIRAARYVPSAAAKQLRTNRSRAIGLRMYPTFDGINGNILDRFLHRLAETLQQSGYRITLFAAADDDVETQTYRDWLTAGSVDGVILTSTTADDPRPAALTAAGVPFVAFGRPWSHAHDEMTSEHSWVDVDGGAGISQIVDDLLGLGHTRIGYIGWPNRLGVGQDRFDGWHQRLEDAGATTRHFALCEDSVDGGREAAHELLADGVTALVCASDTLALGARVVARTEAEAVEPFVFGFDDTPVARAIGLNSVDQPVEDVADTCGQILLAQIEGDGEARRALLQPRVVYRDPRLTHLLAARANAITAATRPHSNVSTG